MNRKTIAFRCPADLLKEVDALCEANYFDRSLVCTLALRQFLLACVAKGLISPIVLEEPTLPPPYTGKKRGRKAHVPIAESLEDDGDDDDLVDDNDDVVIEEEEDELGLLEAAEDEPPPYGGYF